jgi:hypothetical protein
MDAGANLREQENSMEQVLVEELQKLARMPVEQLRGRKRQGSERRRAAGIDSTWCGAWAGGCRC